MKYLKNTWYIYKMDSICEKALALRMNKPKNIDSFKKRIDSKRVLYQACQDLLSEKTTTVYAGLERESMWEHPCYKEHISKAIYTELFIENPYKLVEGVVSCTKCGNNKNYVFTKQKRRADESATTFYECPKCGNKGAYSGR